jgi:hypothetical protein
MGTTARYRVLLCLSVSVLVIGLVRYGRAASPAVTPFTPTSHHAHASATLPLLVDGAVNPGQIPDALAYRHYVSITAVSATASAADVHRRNSLLDPVTLSTADRAAYVAAITNLRDSLQALDAQLAAAQDVTTADGLKQQRRNLLDTAAARIRASLSTDGAARLQAYINNTVKTHIRIYGQ